MTDLEESELGQREFIEKLTQQKEIEIKRQENKWGCKQKKRRKSKRNEWNWKKKTEKVKAENSEVAKAAKPRRYRKMNRNDLFRNIIKNKHTFEHRPNKGKLKGLGLEIDI